MRAHSLRRLSLVLLLLRLLFSFVPVATAAEKRVVFIHTKKSNGSGVILFDKTFQSALGADPSEQITLYNEYTDLWRFEGLHYETEFVSLLRRKYEGQQIDLAFALGGAAVKFLLRHKGELFPDTPIRQPTMAYTR